MIDLNSLAFSIFLVLVPTILYFDFIVFKKFKTNKLIISAKILSKKKIVEDDTDKLEVEVEYYYSISFKAIIKEIKLINEKETMIYIDKKHPYIYSNSYTIFPDFFMKYIIGFFLFLGYLFKYYQ